MNNSIFYFFYNFAHQSSFADALIKFCAVYLPYVVILFAVVFMLFHHRSFRELSRVLFSGIFAWILSKLLKLLIHTPRPFDALSNVRSLFPENGYSFPSGHASFFFALAFAIFFFHKRVGWVFLSAALVIGLARIAGGVHFPIDILGGAVLGYAVARFLRFH
jgi:undecaprenyl-diphosphatase